MEWLFGVGLVLFFGLLSKLISKLKVVHLEFGDKNEENYKLELPKNVEPTRRRKQLNK